MWNKSFCPDSVLPGIIKKILLGKPRVLAKIIPGKFLYLAKACLAFKIQLLHYSFHPDVGGNTSYFVPLYKVCSPQL